jgi:hypothetical protein
MQRGFGLLGVLFIGALALLVGGLAYGAGLAAGQAGAGTAAGPVVYSVGFWHPFGFGLFGFLFVVLILVLLVRAIAGAGRWGGRGGWGHGWGYGGRGWGPGGPMGPGGPTGQEFSGREVPPMFEPMLEKWHQRAHADATTPAPGAASTEPPPAAGR